MAPSVGHLHKLVVKNAKLLKQLWEKTSSLVQQRLPATLHPTPKLELIPVRVSPRQPLHPAAYLRQSKGRWYTTHSSINAAVRRFTSVAESTPGLKYHRNSFPHSKTASAVNALSGRAPFALTLRPNLTGGALRRTAGGYSLGSGRVGGARYFSHSPAAPAQVIQNVSQAVRAFCISGNKAQYDGVDPRTGEKRYRAVSVLQHETRRKMMSLPQATPGAFIDFQVNPTITALTSLRSLAGYPLDTSNIHNNSHLNTSGLLDVLSIDFSRALRDLAAVLNDLKTLAALGDLPITYSSSSALRIHFPGCDAESVETLCREIGVKRGIVQQDEDFDDFVGTQIALLFPFAPTESASELGRQGYEAKMQKMGAYGGRDPIDWQNMMLQNDDDDDGYSTHSEADLELFEQVGQDNLWAEQGDSFPEEYQSTHTPSEISSENESPLEFRDLDGIYRFIELCDSSRNARR